MYAIFRAGGKQYRAHVGEVLDVERLPNEVGESFEIEEVLLVGDGDNTVIGQPTVEGAKIKVTVEEQFRDKKLIVYKYNQRTNYRRKKGHRHYYTRLKIDDIIV